MEKESFLYMFLMVILRKKHIPQYLFSRCGMNHLNYSLEKLGKTFKLQEELLKTEMNHDDADGNNYMNKKDEWLPYIKQDILCAAFSYARSCKTVEDITGFSMKDFLSLPGLGWNLLIHLEEKKTNLYTLITTNT